MSLKRIVVAIASISLAASLFGGCGSYMPAAKKGTCNPTRQWVEPVEDTEGNWKDGYCKNKG